MSKALGKGLEALIQNNNSEESTNYLLGKIDIEKVSYYKKENCICYK